MSMSGDTDVRGRVVAVGDADADEPLEFLGAVSLVGRDPVAWSRWRRY